MEKAPLTRADDAIARGLDEWMAEVPDADHDVEAARQRVAGLARLLERGLEQIASRHGFTLGDWDALSALQRSGPPYERSPKELAKAVGVTSGTMSIRIDRLAAARLTERAPARTDGRSRPIRLTGKGRRRWQAATAERTQLEATLTHQALTSTELQELNLLLAKLLAAFEERFGTAPVRGPGQADQPSL